MKIEVTIFSYLSISLALGSSNLRKDNTDLYELLSSCPCIFSFFLSLRKIKFLSLLVILYIRRKASNDRSEVNPLKSATVKDAINSIKPHSENGSN